MMCLNISKSNAVMVLRRLFIQHKDAHVIVWTTYNGREYFNINLNIYIYLLEILQYKNSNELGSFEHKCL